MDLLLLSHLSEILVRFRNRMFLLLLWQRNAALLILNPRKAMQKSFPEMLAETRVTLIAVPPVLSMKTIFLDFSRHTGYRCVYAVVCLLDKANSNGGIGCLDAYVQLLITAKCC